MYRTFSPHVTLLGEAGVGKTCLTYRFMGKPDFPDELVRARLLGVAAAHDIDIEKALPIVAAPCILLVSPRLTIHPTQDPTIEDLYKTKVVIDKMEVEVAFYDTTNREGVNLC